MPDIDIDLSDRDVLLKKIHYIPASRTEGDALVKHNTGVYLQKTPLDIEKNLCKIPYNDQSNNFFKIDFLNVSLYKDVKNENHLIELMNKEPLWDLLEQEDFVNLLFHINGHADICKKMKPHTVEQLAAVLAVIRPAKRHLLARPMEEVLREVWTKPQGNEYYFKKSHATAYAIAIVVQMNLICEKISYEYY
jgi:DNA polymerase III alpha subunit